MKKILALLVGIKIGALYVMNFAQRSGKDFREKAGKDGFWEAVKADGKAIMDESVKESEAAAKKHHVEDFVSRGRTLMENYMARAQELSKEAREEMLEELEELSKKAKEAKKKIIASAKEMKEKTKEEVAELKEEGGEMLDSAKKSVKKVTAKVKEDAKELGPEVREKGKDVTDKA